MTHYLVRHRDGRHIAKAISDYTLAGGEPYRWTIHKSRAHGFSKREVAEQMVAVALEDDPDCGAGVVEEEG